jgi:hypothetical protein
VARAVARLRQLSLLAILLNCVNLVLWDPNDKEDVASGTPGSARARFLAAADDIFVWVFVGEAAIRIFALGVWNCPRPPGAVERP